MIPAFYPAAQVIELDTKDDKPIRLGAIMDIKPMSVVVTADRAWGFSSSPEGPWFPVDAGHPFDLTVADASDWWVRSTAPATMHLFARGLPG